MKLITIILGILLTSYPPVLSQEYFDLSKDFPCASCQNYNANFKEIKHYSMAEIKLVFNAINKSGVEFNYPQGGCQNRAQTMSMMLAKTHNIEHCKVWLFSPADLVDGNKTALEIQDKNQLAPNNIIKWLYHVAPCILVDNNGKVDTLVIDPSIDNSQPLMLAAWLRRISNSAVSKYTFLEPEWYFFLTRISSVQNDNSKITGEFYKFEADPRGWINNYSNLTLEKGLAINDLAMYVNKKYIIPLRSSGAQSDVAKLSDFKKAFGNVDALTALFGSQTSYMGNLVSDNIYLRILQEKYPEFMLDAMKYYIDRVAYWTTEVVKLR